MPRGKQSKGQCAYCGQEMSKGGVIRHLSTCPQRQELIARVERKPAPRERLYHLRVQAAGQSEFWLDLEMRGTAPLQDLDDYLRAIWLECCGHLSRFSIGRWGGNEISMRRKVGEVFEPGVELTHIYDFGTSSETLVKSVGLREGRSTTSHPIALMVRNLPPIYKCTVCERSATWLCMECVIEKNEWGTLCNSHVRKHPHHNYGDPVPLMNSPRLGLCGYDGPAESPY